MAVEKTFSVTKQENNAGKQENNIADKKSRLFVCNGSSVISDQMLLSDKKTTSDCLASSPVLTQVLLVYDKWSDVVWRVNNIWSLCFIFWLRTRDLKRLKSIRCFLILWKKFSLRHGDFCCKSYSCKLFLFPWWYYSTLLQLNSLESVHK